MKKGKNDAKTKLLSFTRLFPNQWLGESKSKYFDIRYLDGQLHYGMGKSSLAAELDLEPVGQFAYLPSTEEIIDIFDFEIADWIEFD